MSEDIDLPEQMQLFGKLATEFAESATTLVGVSVRMQMLMLEQARDGLSEMTSELDDALANTNATQRTDD